VRRAAPLGAIRFVQRNRNTLRHRQQERFDRRHRVDTAGYLFTDQMQVIGGSAQHGNHYEATWRGSVRRMIRSLDIDTSEHTFLDIGSGKGAVLLYASEFPFRQVVGIEHEPTLHAVAEANLATWLATPRATGDVRSVCADALDHELPDGPLVVFFCHPFSAEGTRRFAGRAEASLLAAPRPFHLISFNPGVEDVLDAVPWLERTAKGWSHATYRARPELSRPR
jgi:SAM-dependent methyltransferase